MITPSSSSGNGFFGRGGEMECPPPRFKGWCDLGVSGGLAAGFGEGRRRAALGFSSARRGISDRFGHRHGFEGLTGGHQNRRVVGRQRSRRGGRQANGCGGLVVRNLRDEDHVVLSEREEDLLELSPADSMVLRTTSSRESGLSTRDF